MSCDLDSATRLIILAGGLLRAERITIVLGVIVLRAVFAKCLRLFGRRPRGNSQRVSRIPFAREVRGLCAPRTYVIVKVRLTIITESIATPDTI